MENNKRNKKKLNSGKSNYRKNVIINTNNNKTPKTSPATAKRTRLVIPAAIQINTAGKKAKNAPTTIPITNKKFKSISKTPTSKDTNVCSENIVQAFLIAAPNPLSSTTRAHRV